MNSTTFATIPPQSSSITSMASRGNCICKSLTSISGSSPTMIERINCSDTAMMTKPSEHGAMAKPMVAAARMSGMSTSAAAASVKSVFDVDVNMILSLGLMGCGLSLCTPGRVRGAAPGARSVQRKALADPLFALLPERLCVLWIDGVRLYARAYGRVRGDLGQVTVLAIAAANRCGDPHAGTPD